MNMVMRKLARRVGAVVAECNYAQRRITVLQSSPDHYLVVPGQAPDTYQEFLLRTAGILEHEPSAAARSGRPKVR
jgi:hypothetical protein